MKRYSVFSFDFDSRAQWLEPVQDQWDEKVKELHNLNREATVKELAEQFGNWSIEQIVKNFQDLASKPCSVAAYHNEFLEQIRNSFVVGSYYQRLQRSSGNSKKSVIVLSTSTPRLITMIES